MTAGGLQNATDINRDNACTVWSVLHTISIHGGIKDRDRPVIQDAFHSTMASTKPQGIKIGFRRSMSFTPGSRGYRYQRASLTEVNIGVENSSFRGRGVVNACPSHDIWSGACTSHSQLVVMVSEGGCSGRCICRAGPVGCDYAWKSSAI